MSRAPRPRAFCTFCERTRALLASGHPVRHNAAHQSTGCNGMRYEAQMCEACDGAGKIKTMYGTYLDAPCNVCTGAKRIIK